MRVEEFFNLMPEEQLVLEYRYSWPGKSAYEVGEATEWGKSIVKRNENQALNKIATKLKNLGIIISKDALRISLEQRSIVLDGLTNNNDYVERKKNE